MCCPWPPSHTPSQHGFGPLSTGIWRGMCFRCVQPILLEVFSWNLPHAEPGHARPAVFSNPAEPTAISCLVSFRGSFFLHFGAPSNALSVESPLQVLAWFTGLSQTQVITTTFLRINHLQCHWNAAHPEQRTKHSWFSPGRDSCSLGDT